MQGAVMVTLLSVFAFGLGLFRFRYSRHWFAFVVATFRWGVQLRQLTSVA